MKYNLPTENIPQSEREEINKKILYLIENDKCETEGIAKQDIYEAYTGDGHLHNLKFDDFNNFHEYSEAKREIEKGQFYTAPHILKFIADTLQFKSTDLIADLTSGKGDLFNFCPNEKNCYSNEIDIKSYKVQKYLYPDINITQNDIRNFTSDIRFDYIFGNPPFSLKLKYNNEDTTSEMIYIHKSYEHLKTGGIFALLVPKSFANDDFMDKSVINTLNKYFYFICQYEIPSNSFKHVGINNFDTKVMYFQKRSDVLDKILSKDNDTCLSNPYPYKLKFENISLHNKGVYEIADIIHIQNKLKPFYEIRDKYKTKLIAETKSKIDTSFGYKINKMLYHIKVNPTINKKYEKCKTMLNNLYSQEKPEGMDIEKWNKIKLTPKKVLNYCKRVLKSQNKKTEKDIILPVRNKENFYLKAYSKKMKKELEDKKNKGEIISYNYLRIITDGNSHIFNNSQKSYINKKYNSYRKQSLSFNQMDLDVNIQNWLNSHNVYDYINETEIVLNDVQKEIVNKMLQKKYGYIQASQGSGKTLMSINMALYRLENNNIRNVIVVAPSIAINGTWIEVLKAYQIPYAQIKSISDINKIKEKDFVIITYNMMMKYYKHIKRYIKLKNNKVYTIIDEADGICNITGKTSKSVIAGTFKSKYKTCLSGTMTRNNIAEAYTQLEWLYGNSENFICECSEVFSVSKEKIDKGEIKSNNNEDYFNPFPRYQKGLKLFKSCFNPEKITVFGIEKQNQDIYNPDELKDIINKTIITKSFEEVVGKKIYDIRQILIPFNEAEKQLYYKAIQHFQEMKYLFTSTGNPRKDKFLEILQQLNLLLDICRTPNTYKEYFDYNSNIPNKYKKILEMLKDFQNEYVAIGCRTLKEVSEYEKTISTTYPNRKLFVITGAISINERKNIIQQLENSKNGILLSTQQSLSSSVNINFVNKCIITSSAWNYSTLSQYYFRFIRYNSTEHKDIYFVMYENSLECNLLGLLLAKEKLVRFMKNDNIDDDNLKEEFGVDFNLIEMLLTKSKDENGYSRINWGNSNL